MSSQRYVALLRGINVGGRNKVAMADLRAVFARNGFDDVSTYIQSGNVLFASSARRDSIEGEIEAMLERDLELPIMVTVRSRVQMRNVLRGAPPGFGREPDKYHSDAVFLKKPLTAAKAMRVVTPKEGVDRAWPGAGVIYFRRLSARRTQSRLSRIMSTPEYALMTIRNWNTTMKLLDMIETR
jgi:uncharacterized protein (DUF1697 family)